ncbi:MAG TPA: transposase domain-containing protein, partial [Spirochaetia bacterium]|nr:transposase domain-containing protein [Spirochaetia bacterium]
LFSATPRGARSSAILYSLVESAKLQKLEVYDYFNYILRKIPYCESRTDYEALLPFNLTSEQIKP